MPGQKTIRQEFIESSKEREWFRWMRTESVCEWMKGRVAPDGRRRQRFAERSRRGPRRFQTWIRGRTARATRTRSLRSFPNATISFALILFLLVPYSITSRYFNVQASMQTHSSGSNFIWNYHWNNKKRE